MSENETSKQPEIAEKLDSMSRSFFKAAYGGGYSVLQTLFPKKLQELDRAQYKDIYNIVDDACERKHIEKPKLYHYPIAAYGTSHIKQGMPHVIPKPDGMVMSDTLLAHFTPQEASMYVFHEMGHEAHPLSHLGLKIQSRILEEFLIKNGPFDTKRECEADREALKLYDHPEVLLSMLTKMKKWAVDHLGNADWSPGIDARISQARQLTEAKHISDYAQAHPKAIEAIGNIPLSYTPVLDRIKELQHIEQSSSPLPTPSSNLTQRQHYKN